MLSVQSRQACSLLSAVPAQRHATNPLLGHRSTRRCVQRWRNHVQACISLSSPGDAAYMGPAGTPNSHAAEELQVGIRPAAIRDYWAIAEVHAQSFYPSANWLFAQLLRLDRVFALQMGTDNDLKGKQGRFQCFVAYDLDAEGRAQYDAQGRGTPGADVPAFFKFLLAEPLRAGFELSPAQIGLLGAVVVDMQASHLPAERVEKGPFVAYEQPQDVAYVSNLAVIPHARRRGIGEQLLAAAENAAREWGCKRLTLHCDASNEAASGLYRKHKYTTLSKEGPWMAFLQGKQVRLELMARDIC